MKYNSDPSDRERIRQIERATEREIRRIRDSITEDEWFAEHEPPTYPTTNIHVHHAGLRERISDSLTPSPQKARTVMIVSVVTTVVAAIFEALRMVGVLK